MLVFFPVFIIWTGLGVGWYSDEVENKANSANEYTCLTEEVTWIILFWIFFSAFVVIMYFLTLLTLLLSLIYERNSDLFID